jgi:hypothetical protein
MDAEQVQEVDQNLEEGAGASTRDSLLRGPEDSRPILQPTIPISKVRPQFHDWPDGPKTEPEIVVDQLRKVQRRVVQITAQDEFGNDTLVNFVLENEADDEDRFFVRKVE